MNQIGARFLLLVSALASVGLLGCGQQESIYEKAFRAIYHKDAKLLQLIVGTNRSVLSEVSGFDGSTLLHAALVNTPTVECAGVLISSGIDVNKADVTGKSPLHLLCKFSADPDAIRLLLTNGVAINGKDKSGKTALYYAKTEGQSKEAIALLESHGAKD